MFCWVRGKGDAGAASEIEIEQPPSPHRPFRIFGQAAALASIVVAAVLCGRFSRRRNMGPRPPFEWEVLRREAQSELVVSGPWREIVATRGNNAMAGWVIPAHGRREMRSGQIHRWALVVEQVSRHQPEIQFGIQGVNFARPWRLVTTSRCSCSRDEEPWQGRKAGDRRIRERDVMHLELDLCNDPGSLWLAVNDEPFEIVFCDIPLAVPLLPVVMLGGQGSRVRVEVSARRVSESNALPRGSRSPSPGQLMEAPPRTQSLRSDLSW